MKFEKKKRCLFIKVDRVITLTNSDEILFSQNVFTSLKRIQEYTDYNIVLLVNRECKSEEYALKTISRESIYYDTIYSLDEIEKSYPEKEYELSKSIIISDEDVNDLSIKRILYSDNNDITGSDICFISSSWNEIASFLTQNDKLLDRRSSYERKTLETAISLEINLDGSGKGRVKSGLGFFDHMIEQIIKHSKIDLNGSIVGDLIVDEHHSVEDFAITLGYLINKALKDKRGINRYGSDILIMDDVVARVCIDFSSRSEFIYDVNFDREYIGSFPTEMILHFFKSFSNAAQCNLYLSVTKGNAHHMAEALFKAFARSIKVAIKRDPSSNELPSTKGVL